MNATSRKICVRAMNRCHESNAYSSDEIEREKKSDNKKKEDI